MLGGARANRLIEQVAIIDGLWRTPLGKTYSFEGRYYRLKDSPALPNPVQQPRPPIIIGGHGKRRSIEFAAGFADEFNVGWRDVQVRL
jgi:alkanesulfonate monooxygenase SsuD/methylene tetrahydromethanopterin reductase-like flavin-dependent oxidoreductase (luciferase family)